MWHDSPMARKPHLAGAVALPWCMSQPVRECGLGVLGWELNQWRGLEEYMLLVPMGF